MQNAEESAGAAAFQNFPAATQLIYGCHDAAAQLIDPFAAAVYVRPCAGEST